MLFIIQIMVVIRDKGKVLGELGLTTLVLKCCKNISPFPSPYWEQGKIMKIGEEIRGCRCDLNKKVYESVTSTL